MRFPARRSRFAMWHVSVRLCRSDKAVSGNDGEEPCVLVLPLWRQRPLLTECLVVLGPEERGLHSAVDDVPGQRGVAAAVAEDVEVGVHAGLLDGGPPVLAVPLRRLDDG